MLNSTAPAGLLAGLIANLPHNAQPARDGRHGWCFANIPEDGGPQWVIAGPTYPGGIDYYTRLGHPGLIPLPKERILLRERETRLPDGIHFGREWIGFDCAIEAIAHDGKEFVHFPLATISWEDSETLLGFAHAGTSVAVRRLPQKGLALWRPVFGCTEWRERNAKVCPNSVMSRDTAIETATQYLLDTPW